MARDKVWESLEDSLIETHERLREEGLLLVSALPRRRPNAMAIGWGLIGRFWRDPFFMVAVRRSRFTHSLIEKSGQFTVNVPSPRMKKVVDFCGSVSGRDHDKFKEIGITAAKSRRLSVPIISECPIHYECEVLFRSQVLPKALGSGIRRRWYRSKDYHTLYFGRILSIY